MYKWLIISFIFLFIFLSGCWIIPAEDALFKSMEENAREIEVGLMDTPSSMVWNHGEIDGKPIYQAFAFTYLYDGSYYYLQVDDYQEGSGRTDLDVVFSIDPAPLGPEGGEIHSSMTLVDDAYYTPLELFTSNFISGDLVYIIFSPKDHEDIGSTFSFRVFKTETQL